MAWYFSRGICKFSLNAQVSYAYHPTSTALPSSPLTTLHHFPPSSCTQISSLSTLTSSDPAVGARLAARVAEALDAAGAPYVL
jgi:hypothetical protein